MVLHPYFGVLLRNNKKNTNLKTIMLGERNPTQNIICFMIPLT